MKVYLRKAVGRDITDISYYSRTEFGEAQELEYLAGLWHHFQLLAEFPLLAPEYRIGSPIRVSIYRLHRVLYQRFRDGIRINRVVHQSRDPDRILPRR